MIKNYMLDKDFLDKLSLETNREFFARILSLDFDENILEEITGRIISGSISIDGSSSSRRTCSLTIVANDFSPDDYYWGVKTKFKLELGIKNNIDKRYDDIIWFNFGKYVISSFSSSQGVNNYTISIQGKDKMSLLNGDLGGIINSLTWDFGSENYLGADGTITKRKMALREIIKECVHTFAKEPYHNIIINNLDETALKLMAYHGEDPIYLILNKYTNSIVQFTLDGETELYSQKKGKIKINSLAENEYNNRIILAYDEAQTNADEALNFKFGKDNEYNYNVIKCNAGEAVGYYLTELVYDGDLIANTGASVTTEVLDKIIQMLGNYEYFYNVEGQFIFQKKRSYKGANWNNIIKNNDQTYVENSMLSSQISYSFVNNKLLTQVSNNYNINEIKNDFSIWGERKSSSSSGLPIHMRYAIDKKPEFYMTYNGDVYKVKDNDFNGGNYFDGDIYTVDWREIIYQMALDSNKYGHEDDFLYKIASNNKNYYPGGYTNYEQYYVDLEGFWRQLYDPFYIEEYDVFGSALNERITKKNEGTNFYYFIRHTAEDFFNPKGDYYEFDNKDTGTMRKIKLTEKRFNQNKVKYLEKRQAIRKFYKLDTKDINGKTYLDKINDRRNKTEVEEIKKGFLIYGIMASASLGLKIRIGKKSFEELKNYNTNTYNPSLLNSFIEKYKEKIPSDSSDKFFQINYKNFYTAEGGVVNSNTGENIYIASYNDCLIDTIDYYVLSDYKRYDTKTHWNILVKNAPEQLLFWFDFLDTEGQLSQYSVRRIGDRPKAENDTDVSSIYYREVPYLVFIDQDLTNQQLSEIKIEKTGYNFMRLPKTYQVLFSQSGSYKSAQDKLENLLYKHACCPNSITLTSIPVYHLEPNTRILVENKEKDINGEYIIDKINFSISHNSTMTISAIKDIDNII